MQSPNQLSSHGFLGSTSFASVYLENEDLWKTSPPQSTSSTQTPISDTDISRGAECLWLLRDLPLWAPFIEKWANGVMYSMIAPWVIEIQDSLRVQLADHWSTKTESQMAKACHQLSHRIWRTSQKPLSFDGHTTFDQYQKLLVGPNLRWESMSIYFHAVGLTIEALEYVEDLKLSNDSFQSRRELARKMLEVGETCILFSEKAGSLTDAQTWVYLESFHLTTLVDGDAAFSSWKRLGDSISICVAQGLHEVKKPSVQVPFWLSEVRKRAFSVAYICDKGQANFMGRPPRLPRRYCSMQLPLDLDLEQLRLPDEQLANEIAKLDENGWNTNQETRSTVFVRAGLIMSMINEDILELMMSSLPLNYEATGQDILRRSRDAYESLPHFVKVPESSSRPGAFYGDLLDMVGLDYIYNEFLVHRALVVKQRSNNDILIESSGVILAKVIGLIRLHHSTKFTGDLPWIISKYTLPVAGILCIELLRQSQGYPVARTFNRSEVVQNLSSLLPTLRWIRTRKTVNHEICEQARISIEKILDTVLDAPTPPASSGTLGGEETGAVTTELEALDMLQNTLSLPEFWSLLPHHPLLAET